MMTFTALLGLLEPLSIAVLLTVIGLLSKRLGDASHSPPRYAGFFVGAALMGLNTIVRFAVLIFALAAPQQTIRYGLWLLLLHGLPAVALTLGLVGAWRYWSWLLAERT